MGKETIHTIHRRNLKCNSTHKQFNTQTAQQGKKVFYLCKNLDPCMTQANKWVNIFVLSRSLYLQHSFFRY